MCKGGRLTMAGTNVRKPGLSPDRRMQQAAVKPDPEVIADPRGTAVNTAMLLQSPQAAWATPGRREHTEPNPLMWSQPTLKEIGGGEPEEKVPEDPERGVCL